MDFFKMLSVTERAVRRAREGKGPTFVEAICYRYRGHSMADPATYRTKEEVELWEKRDVIPKIKAVVKHDFEVGDEVFEEVDKRVRKDIEEAVKYAESGQELPIDRLYDFVYTD
jgi:pyruvate dehydrogenase E1 component alpha subunit